MQPGAVLWRSCALPLRCSLRELPWLPRKFTSNLSCGGLFSQAVTFTRGVCFPSLQPLLLSLRFSYKPAIAAGRWGFDGGAAKSDCVEMAIREIVDMVLWDEGKAAFNLELLPRSAAAGLRDMCVRAVIVAGVIVPWRVCFC